MKTLNQVREEIDRLMKVGANTRDRSEKNSIRKRLQFLRPVAMYMETNPTEESVSRQLNECVKKMDVIQKEFDHTYPSYCDTKTKSEFMKGKDLPELKKQVKVLQYLLESK
jgi:BMFP domain-containing protein YqiC